MAAPVDRRRVGLGGAVGTAVGAGLAALAGFFAVAPWDEPSQALGVFLPAAVAAPALALGLAALLPLRLGDTPRGALVVTRAWTGVAVLVVLLAVAGLVRARLPWSLAALAPLAFAVLLVRAARASAARVRADDATG